MDVGILVKKPLTSGENLKRILCKSKSKVLPKIYAGVYQLNCTCNGKYIEISKKQVSIPSVEHRQYMMKGDGSA